MDTKKKLKLFKRLQKKFKSTFQITPPTSSQIKYEVNYKRDFFSTAIPCTAMKVKLCACLVSSKTPVIQLNGKIIPPDSGNALIALLN